MICTSAARRFVTAAAVIGAMWCAHPITAQVVVEPQLKAAFLYSFVKFIEWPDLAPTDPISVCVADSPAVADSLKAATQQRRAQERELAVTQLAQDTVPKTCHVVYVAEQQEARARRWLVALQGSAAFTIGDFEHFARLGGVANFIVTDGRLRFAINVDAARRAGLRISSRMLSLATIVKDESGTTQ